MIRYLLILSCLLGASTQLTAASRYEIIDYKFEGLHRTDENWARSFLQLYSPASLSEDDCKILASKLMTSDVFTSVDYRLEEAVHHKGGHQLVFKIKEKWTTIPVVRGSMGGGIPLRVIGIYDTHAFGKLWTLGGEIRKYGTASPGWVFWARAPRWLNGHHYISTEYWNIPRVRNIYDRKDDIIGDISTNDSIVLLEYLRPIETLRNIASRGSWKYGLKLKIKKMKKEILKLNSTDTPGWNIATEGSQEWHFIPRIAFDNVVKNNFTISGFKFHLGTGIIHDQGVILHQMNSEIFYYKNISSTWTLASHLLLSSTGSRKVSNLLFFGGLDSVRGYPDSIIYGSDGGYANLELRHLSHRGKYVHIQSIAFYDAGDAGFSWGAVGKSKRSSIGFGIRIGSPHIYRLVVRIDYAWSIESKFQGLSIGLNQFFQPYKPL